MKRILAYVSTDPQPSMFDLVVAYDGGADVVIPFAGVSADSVKDVVYGCVFTRHPKDLASTAVFVGGKDVDECENVVGEIKRVLEDVPSPLRISVGLDPSGAYTTSAAAVAKIKGALGNLRGLNATVLGGTGGVGKATSVLLAKEGCNVYLTSRKRRSAEDACKSIKKKYGNRLAGGIKPVERKTDDDADDILSNSDVVVSTGALGVQMMSKKTWTEKKRIKVLADLNAVAPYGIEGVKPNSDGEKIGGKTCFGAIAVGELKMRSHLALIGELFGRNGVVFDLHKVYEITGVVEAESLVK